MGFDQEPEVWEVAEYADENPDEYGDAAQDVLNRTNLWAQFQ